VHRRHDGKLADVESAKELGRRGGEAKARRVRLVDSLGLSKLVEGTAFGPYRAAAEEFVAHHRSVLAQQAGGELGPAPSTMVASAGLQLAASRWAFDQGATKNDAGLLKLGSSLANDSRQNLLAAYELATREAAARPRVPPSTRSPASCRNRRSPRDPSDPRPPVRSRRRPPRTTAPREIVRTVMSDLDLSFSRYFAPVLVRWLYGAMLAILFVSGGSALVVGTVRCVRDAVGVPIDEDAAGAEAIQKCVEDSRERLRRLYTSVAERIAAADPDPMSTCKKGAARARLPVDIGETLSALVACVVLGLVGRVLLELVIVQFRISESLDRLARRDGGP
jgi:hypothetical protein